MFEWQNVLALMAWQVLRYCENSLIAGDITILFIERWMVTNREDFLNIFRFVSIVR